MTVQSVQLELQSVRKRVEKSVRKHTKVSAILESRVELHGHGRGYSHGDVGMDMDMQLRPPTYQKTHNLNQKLNQDQSRGYTVYGIRYTVCHEMKLTQSPFIRCTWVPTLTPCPKNWRLVFLPGIFSLSLPRPPGF